MPMSVRAVNWSGEGRRTPGWYALAMLGSIAFLAYLYRMLWSVLSISIKTEMGLSDTAVGLLGGFGFALSYAITSLPFSFFIDLGNRVRILSACAALWALASVGCGLASSVPFLLAARLLVGVGEAGCLPSSYSLLVDFVPTHKRAFAFGILDALGSVGVMVGVSLSGWMASSVGWRNTFIFLGLPGVLAAAVLLFTVQEPSQTANYDLASAEQYWKRFSSLVRRPTFRWITECSHYTSWPITQVCNGCQASLREATTCRLAASASLWVPSVEPAAWSAPLLGHLSRLGSLRETDNGSCEFPPLLTS